MKELGRKKNFKKGIYTLLLAAILICSGFSALANAAGRTSTLNTNLDKLSDKPTGSPGAAPSYVEILSENFSDGNMPPTDQSWELKQTNPTETWHIDNSIPQYPLAKPSATVHREASNTTQDEWLITPSLNFSNYSIILLTVYWYTCYYVTAYNNHRYIEFNISVSTDGGVTWTNVWSFNDNLSKFFHDWTWYKYFSEINNNPIDLSKYAGENNVKIGFQYYSNHLDQADEQMFSIDDITLLGNDPVKFTCNAGGPYEWWWPMQYNYFPNGVRFHGNFTTEGTPVLLQWFWDFGDGNTSIVPYYTWHFYKDVGIYNITLTIRDNNTYPPRVTFNHTTVKLFLLKPPGIDIKAHLLISIGIVADIKNSGEYNASYVNWRINISWGLLQMLQRRIANGTIENVGAGTSATVRSKLYFFGFGIIHIIISAYPENLPGIIKHYNGLKIGPLVFIFKETGLR